MIKKVKIVVMNMKEVKQIIADAFEREKKAEIEKTTR